MKRLALALLVSCAAAPRLPGPPEGLHEGVAQLHDAHCGGAMLTDLQRAQLIRPARGLRFWVFAGDRNSSAAPVAELTTSTGGTFRVSLPAPGKYCVVDANRPRLTPEDEARILSGQASAVVAADECRARLPLACDAIWESDREGFEARIDLQGSRCAWDQPCVTGGPGPP